MALISMYTWAVYLPHYIVFQLLSKLLCIWIFIPFPLKTCHINDVCILILINKINILQSAAPVPTTDQGHRSWRLIYLGLNASHWCSYRKESWDGCWSSSSILQQLGGALNLAACPAPWRALTQGSLEGSLSEMLLLDRSMGANSVLVLLSKAPGLGSPSLWTLRALETSLSTRI